MAESLSTVEKSCNIHEDTEKKAHLAEVELSSDKLQKKSLGGTVASVTKELSANSVEGTAFW